jgi:hypothetical protein
LYRSPRTDSGDPAIPDQDHAITDGVLRWTRIDGAPNQSERCFRGEAGLKAIEAADKKRQSQCAEENRLFDSDAEIYLQARVWLARP